MRPLHADRQTNTQYPIPNNTQSTSHLGSRQERRISTCDKWAEIQQIRNVESEGLSNPSGDSTTRGYNS